MIAVTALLSLAPQSLLAATQKVDPPPNILLIMADDLGYETLGSYGGTSYATPNLDKLAETGILFKNCHSMPMCSPSRVTIMTGRYTFRTTTKWGHIPDDEITFGSVLKSAGYKTALAGKWQMSLLKDNPHHVTQKGFDETCAWAWHEGSRYWNPVIYQNGKILTEVADRYGPDIYTEFLINFMANHRQEPFLAYYPMCLVHATKKHDPKGPNGKWGTYKEMVESMDKEIGKLVSALDRLELRKKTLILFTADNGSPNKVTSYIGDKPIKGRKGTLKDAGTHVPLIANWPGTAPSGRINEDLIDFTDFMPTLAELTGAKLPNVKIDGSSFAPQLRGMKGTPREWIYSEWRKKAWVRNKQWKLYRSGKLYDMVNNPLENSPRQPRWSASTEAKKAKIQLQSIMDNLKAE